MAADRYTGWMEKNVGQGALPKGAHSDRSLSIHTASDTGLLRRINGVFSSSDGSTLPSPWDTLTHTRTIRTRNFSGRDGSVIFNNAKTMVVFIETTPVSQVHRGYYCRVEAVLLYSARY